MSKSKGQALRLAAIFHAFFMAWNSEEVEQFESNSLYPGFDEVPAADDMIYPWGNHTIPVSDEEISDDVINEEDSNGEEMNGDGVQQATRKSSISVMAMQAAISFVTYALNQNMIIQVNINFCF